MLSVSFGGRVNEPEVSVVLSTKEVSEHAVNCVYYRDTLALSGLSVCLRICNYARFNLKIIIQRKYSISKLKLIVDMLYEQMQKIKNVYIFNTLYDLLYITNR